MAVPRGSGGVPPFFCIQSPGPARAGSRPYQLGWCLGGVQAVANYLCRSQRPGVHTAIICVGRDGRAYTHNYQLFMYMGASAAP